MHFLCRSFIGRDPAFWSRFWENEPDNPEVRLTKGHLFSLISITDSTGADLSVTGRALIDDLTSIYFSSQHLSPELAFKAITTVLSGPDFQHLSPTLVLLALVKDRLHLYLYGDTAIYLYRTSKVCLLSRASVGESSTLQGQVIPGDLLLFGHKSFFDQYGESELHQPLPTTPSALEDIFLTRLMEFSTQSTGAALVSILPDPDSLTATPMPAASASSQPPPSVQSPPHSSKFSFFKPRPVFVTPVSSTHSQRHGTLNLFLSLGVIVLIGLLVAFGYQRNQQLSVNRQTKELITQIESNLNQALSVKNLDPDAALALTQKAKTQLSKLKLINPNNPQALSLSKQVDQLAGRTGSGEDFNPPLFYDATLLSTNPEYQKMLLVGDQLALIDPASGRVDMVHLTLRSKSNFYQNPDLSSAQYFWVSGNRILSGSSSRLTTVEASKKVLYSFSDTAPYTAAATWNDNSYLVAPSLTDIYKFTPQTKDNFSPPKPWLVSSKLDFSPVSIAINGKIYLLGADCRVRLFDRGNPVDFLSVPITNCRSPSSLSVSSDGSRLAFLDNSVSAYLLDSQGQIKSRFAFLGKKFVDVLLHPTLSKIYFLASDQKIYYLDL
ncbi:MAG: hypothetical protein WCT01_02400 [Candidatus Shapirobacteria bacterium]